MITVVVRNKAMLVPATIREMTFRMRDFLCCGNSASLVRVIYLINKKFPR